MRAWIVDQQGPVAARPMRVVELARAPLPAGGVRIQVRACGVCRTDLHIVEGDLALRRRPVVPGHQIVGVVSEVGDGVASPAVGDRVGVAWLQGTCGTCPYCRDRQENLCDAASFTGWTTDGGFAEEVVARADFVYPLPPQMTDLQAAPLLCAGIIGYRCLRRTGIAPERFEGARIGIYGFGAAGHVAIQIARARGAEVYVMTRDRTKHQALAHELGAAWVGGPTDAPPRPLDASIIFAPAGEIVPPALAALRRGGALVLGGIHMSPIPPLDHALLYGERDLRTVANNTRRDGLEFLAEATEVGVTTHVEAFRLEAAADALIALKHGAVRGAAVLTIE